MRMPFGKHMGKELTSVPKAYLRWLRKQKWVGGSLAAAIAEVFGEPAPQRKQAPWQPSEGEPWEGGNK